MCETFYTWSELHHSLKIGLSVITLTLYPYKECNYKILSVKGALFSNASLTNQVLRGNDSSSSVGYTGEKCADERDNHSRHVVSLMWGPKKNCCTCVDAGIAFTVHESTITSECYIHLPVLPVHRVSSAPICAGDQIHFFLFLHLVHCERKGKSRRQLSESWMYLLDGERSG